MIPFNEYESPDIFFGRRATERRPFVQPLLMQKTWLSSQWCGCTCGRFDPSCYVHAYSARLPTNWNEIETPRSRICKMNSRPCDLCGGGTMGFTSDMKVCCDGENKLHDTRNHSVGFDSRRPANISRAADHASFFRIFLSFITYRSRWKIDFWVSTPVGGFEGGCMRGGPSSQPIEEHIAVEGLFRKSYCVLSSFGGV